MRALEKDREKRYQSAWEMQYDIDTYLASCEFTPSNIHLANFLKQIFEDEIQEEQEQLVRLRKEQARQEPSAYDDMLGEDIIDVDAINGEMLHSHGEIVLPPDLDDNGEKRPSSSSGSAGLAKSEITVPVTERELGSLQTMADRHGMTVEKLLRELVRQQVRWF